LSTGLYHAQPPSSREISHPLRGTVGAILHPSAGHDRIRPTYGVSTHWPLFRPAASELLCGPSPRRQSKSLRGLGRGDPLDNARYSPGRAELGFCELERRSAGPGSSGSLPVMVMAIGWNPAAEETCACPSWNPFPGPERVPDPPRQLAPRLRPTPETAQPRRTGLAGCEASPCGDGWVSPREALRGAPLKGPHDGVAPLVPQMVTPMRFSSIWLFFSFVSATI